MSLFLPPYWSKIIFYFELKLFFMTKAVSNRDICFINAVLLLCNFTFTRTVLLNFAQDGLFCPLPPPHNIRVKVRCLKYQVCISRNKKTAIDMTILFLLSQYLFFKILILCQCRLQSVRYILPKFTKPP